MPFVILKIIARGYLQQGDRAYEQGQTEGAIESYETAIKIDSNLAIAQLRLGQALQKQKQFSEALVAYKKASIVDPNLNIEPNFAVEYNQLGLALQKERKFLEAISAYQKAIQISPQYIDAYINLGKVFSEQERFSEAIATYQQAIQIAPHEARIYNRLGEALAKQKEWKRAIAAYRKAIQLNPQDASFRQNLGKALAQRGKFKQAIAIYRDAIALDASNSDLYNALGEVLYKRRQYQKAIASYNQARQLNPKNAQIYKNLCYAYHSQRKFAEAIAQCEQASKLDPNLGEVKYYIKETRRALAIHRNPKILQMPERVPSLKEDPLVALKRSVVKIIVRSADQRAVGTGWVVKREASRAWVVTNSHVVASQPNQKAKTRIEVEFYSQPSSEQFRKRKPAKLLQANPIENWRDLAILEVNDLPKDIKPLPLSPTSGQLNTPVRVIGHPFTGDDWTVAEGEIRQKNQQEMMLSVALAPGQSGGPVLDRQNRVVGVVAKFRLFCTRSIDLGCGLALPIELVNQQLQEWGIEKRSQES
jgi:tetratricopeptide (TPR) repeat protein